MRSCSHQGWLSKEKKKRRGSKRHSWQNLGSWLQQMGWWPEYGLNLNQPHHQPPRERTIPALDATPTSRDMDEQNQTLTRPCWEFLSHPSTEDSIMKCLRDDWVKNTSSLTTATNKTITINTPLPLDLNVFLNFCYNVLFKRVFVVGFIAKLGVA